MSLAPLPQPLFLKVSLDSLLCIDFEIKFSMILDGFIVFNSGRISILILFNLS